MILRYINILKIKLILIFFSNFEDNSFVISWHVIRSATTRKHHKSYNMRQRDPMRELFQYLHIRNTVSSSTIRATSGLVVSSLHHPCKRPDRLSSYWLSVSFFTICANSWIGLVLDYRLDGKLSNDTQLLLTVWWRPYGLSSRSTSAEVARVSSQGEVIRTGRLYVEPTGLLGSTRILYTGGE